MTQFSEVCCLISSGQIFTGLTYMQMLIHIQMSGFCYKPCEYTVALRKKKKNNTKKNRTFYHRHNNTVYICSEKQPICATCCTEQKTEIVTEDGETSMQCSKLDNAAGKWMHSVPQVHIGVHHNCLSHSDSSPVFVGFTHHCQSNYWKRYCHLNMEKHFQSQQPP